MFVDEQKAKKAKMNIAGKCRRHQPKQRETNVDKQNILVAHSSADSTLTDESLNSYENIFLMFDGCATLARQ